MRFDEKAHTYDQYSNVQADLVTWGSDLLPEKKQNNTVIEFGAGTGLLTQHLINKHEHIFATDISDFMIEQGQKNYPGAFWAKMDAWNPIQNTQYDAIYTSALLQWCPDPTQVLSRWRRCIKKGGKLTALIFIDQTHKELQEIDPELSALQWRTKSFWETAFDHANFTIETSKDSVQSYTYKTSMEFFKAIHGTGSTKSEISKYSKIKGLIKEYNQKFHVDGGVKATWHFLKIQCTA